MQGDKGEVKLMVDGTCVRHGKWLRLLGFDTEIFSELTNIEENIDKRILITRNKKLIGRFNKNILLLPEIPFWKAMRFIIQMLGLERKIKPFTRCSLCNAKVVRIKKEKVKGKVPYHVYELQSSFHICPKCNKIYWGGTHYERFIEDIKTKIGIDV